MKKINGIYEACNQKLWIPKSGFHWVKIINIYENKGIAVIQILASEEFTKNNRRRKKVESPTPDRKYSFLRSGKKELLINDNWKNTKNVANPEKWLPKYLVEKYKKWGKWW